MPNGTEDQYLVAPPVLVVNLATNLIKGMPAGQAWLNLSELEAYARSILANLACGCDSGIENVLSQLFFSEDGNILTVKKELVNRE